MAAPKGNKYNYGNSNTGRPATWTKEVVDKEAEYLLEWCKLETSVVLREFAGLRGYGHRHMYEWGNPDHSRCNQDFRDAFEIAKTIIGCRREQVDFSKSTQRDLAMHFEELDKYENDKLEVASKLRQKENKELANTTDLEEVSQALADSRLEVKRLKAEALAKD